MLEWIQLGIIYLFYFIHYRVIVQIGWERMIIWIAVMFVDRIIHLHVSFECCRQFVDMTYWYNESDSMLWKNKQIHSVNIVAMYSWLSVSCSSKLSSYSLHLVMSLIFSNPDLYHWVYDSNDTDPFFLVLVYRSERGRKYKHLNLNECTCICFKLLVLVQIATSLFPPSTVIIYSSESNSSRLPSFFSVHLSMNRRGSLSDTYVNLHRMYFSRKMSH
jgi:hypothetical protein